MVDLSIIVESLHKLYRSHKTSLDTDLRAAYGVVKKLQSYKSVIQDDLKIRISDDPSNYEGTKRVEHIAISYRR